MPVSDDMQIACTLEGDDLAARVARLRAFTAENLEAHRLDGRVLSLRYRLDAESELRRIVELERACCAFLQFDVQAAPNAVQLTITAPDSAGDAAAWLFDQFLPEQRPISLVTGRDCGSANSCR